MTTSNSGTVAGRVIETRPEKTKQGKDKLTVVIETSNDGSRYANPVAVVAFGGSVEYIAGLQPGDEVQIACYIRGREWQGRYFVDIAPASAAEVLSAQPRQPNPANDTDADMAVPPADDPGMPF
jgi:hypothetical protein